MKKIERVTSTLNIIVGIAACVIMLFVILSIVIFSCPNKEYKPDYTYKWKFAVTYTNGDQDTINCQYNSFNGNECYLYLKIENGGIVSSGVEPCIIMGCGFYSEPVVCGVRKYEILSLDKEILPIKK